MKTLCCLILTASLAFPAIAHAQEPSPGITTRLDGPSPDSSLGTSPATAPGESVSDETL